MVEYGYILATHDNQTVTLRLRILYACHDVVLINGLAGDKFVTYKAKGAVCGDIAVDEVFDGP